MGRATRCTGAGCVGHGSETDETHGEVDAHGIGCACWITVSPYKGGGSGRATASLALHVGAPPQAVILPLPWLRRGIVLANRNAGPPTGLQAPLGGHHHGPGRQRRDAPLPPRLPPRPHRPEGATSPDPEVFRRKTKTQVYMSRGQAPTLPETRKGGKFSFIDKLRKRPQS